MFGTLSDLGAGHGTILPQGPAKSSPKALGFDVYHAVTQ